MKNNKVAIIDDGGNIVNIVESELRGFKEDMTGEKYTPPPGSRFVPLSNYPLPNAEFPKWSDSDFGWVV